MNLPICSSSPSNELLLLDALAVHVGAVEAVEVLHQEAAFVAQHPGVMARHGDVVQEKVAVGAAADGEDVDVEVDGLPLAPSP